MISIDPTLARKNNKRNNNNVRNNQVAGEATSLDPGKDIATVTAQTFQNYKSALRWWHEFGSAEMDKVSSPWPTNIDSAIVKCIATYKRDVGIKKRRGVMTQKKPYNINGYIQLCKYFCKMTLVGNKTTWNEGMFAGLFQKLSVNTIGRSDNIDDC